MDSYNEEVSLLSQPRRVNINTAIRLRKAVIVLSVVNIVALFVLGDAISTGSSAAYAFALDAFLSCASSVVIIWRFYGDSERLYSPWRECVGSLIIGGLTLLSALLVFSQSSYSLIDKELPSNDPFLWWGSIVDAAVCTSLLIATLYLAYKLESTMLYVDAFNTVAGVVLSLATLVSIAVYSHNENIWEIDAVAGIVCSIVLFAYGSWIVYHNAVKLSREKEYDEY